jgi:hypothetical protein
MWGDQRRSREAEGGSEPEAATPGFGWGSAKPLRERCEQGPVESFDPRKRREQGSVQSFDPANRCEQGRFGSLDPANRCE